MWCLIFFFSCCEVLQSTARAPHPITYERKGTLWVNKIPIYWLPSRISVSQSRFPALAAPNFDLYKLRVQVYQVKKLIYIFALIPLMLTRVFGHEVILCNRRLLKSFLELRWKLLSFSCST